MRPRPEISVVCPVGRHAGDLAEVHRRFGEALAGTGRTVEFLYVVDGPRPEAERILGRLAEDRFAVRVFRMARGFGEAVALQFGFERARGRLVLTIPDRLQIAPCVVDRVLERLDAGDEVVVTRRDPRSDPWLNRLQNRVFHRLVAWVARQRFADLTCGVRGFTAEAARKLDLYGDQHRFLPVLAAHAGYQVTEVPGAQLPENGELRLRRPTAYVRRLLDILNIYFLSRFTRRPLRFFGFFGLALGSAGFLISAWLAWQKLFGSSALANRPLLLLGVLLMVLGVQLVSVGLLGEIILFLSTRRAVPEVREIADRGTGGPGGREAASGAGG